MPYEIKEPKRDHNFDNHPCLKAKGIQPGASKYFRSSGSCSKKEVQVASPSGSSSSRKSRSRNESLSRSRSRS